MKNKKLFAILTLVCFMFTFMPVAAMAEDSSSTVWDGTSVDISLFGDTNETEYIITTAGQLAGFAKAVNSGNNFSGKMVKLGADLDLNKQEWTPIGAKDTPFKGTFDGNGKTISNLKLSNSSADYVGLFGSIVGSGMAANSTPSVKDLKLTNVSVEGNYYVGGLAGKGFTCHISNVSVEGIVSGVRYVGGIIGHVYTYFKDCTFTGEANCSFDALGGIAGAGDCRAYDCAVYADVTGNNWVGGIMGNGQEGSSAVRCYVKGTVSSDTNFYWGIGGIAGVAGHGYSISEFKDNYFDGEVYLEGDKVNIPVIGIVNADNNEDLKTTVEGNSWNTEYYPADLEVPVVCPVSADATEEEWAASAKESVKRNNNLVMLESDLDYVEDADEVEIMKFSSVKEDEVIQAVQSNTIDLSQAVINVNAANAQDVLDGKYGDITGKTINFTDNISKVLDLARPTAYQGSKTKYYNYVNSILEESPTEWNENISAVMNSHSHYYRTLNDVTFTSDEGVIIAGFNFESGHNYAGGYDYVRNVATGNGVTYYDHGSLKNITFKDLTITGNAEFLLYQPDASVSDIVFDGCTFTGVVAKEGTAAIKMLADSQYFNNIIVKNCGIDGYYQGVYIQGVDGATVKNNSISNTEHNAIALQSYDVPVKGDVSIEENYIANIADRAIRLNAIGEANITINNNIIVNAGDEDGQVIKAGEIEEAAIINLENNYWDGKEITTAVNGLNAPATIGVIAGTFPASVEGLEQCCAEGYVLTRNADGTYSVAEASTPIVPPSSTTSGSGGGFSGKYNYPVNIADVAGATVTSSDNYAVAGETVTITIDPEAGKQVDEVIVTDADGKEIAVTKVGDNKYTFTMPAGKVNVAVTTEAADYDLRIVMQINNKNIVNNNKTITNDVAPVIVGDRTLVPVRVVTELLGGTADWDDATRTVTLTIDGKVLKLVIDQPIPGFGTSATIINDRTYVPIRYAAEKLGANVEWIAATQQIIIEK